VRGRDSVLVWLRCDALVLPVLWMLSWMFAHNDEKWATRIRRELKVTRQDLTPYLN